MEILKMDNSIIKDFKMYCDIVSNVNYLFCIKPDHGFKNPETRVVLSLIYDAIKASFPYYFNNQIEINIKNNEKVEYYKLIYNFIHNLADIIQLLNDVINEKRKRIFYHKDYNFNDIISIMEILSAYYPGNFLVKYETLNSFILVKKVNLNKYKIDALKEVISKIQTQIVNIFSDYQGYLLEYQREVILKYISNFNNDNISKLAA